MNMQWQFVKQYRGKYANITVNNKILNGVVVDCNSEKLKLQTDVGLLQLDVKNIQDIQQLNQQNPIFIYVCKNQICKCKGIRLLNGKKKLTWPCKHLKEFNCTVKKVTNFNQLPLQLKNKFLDGLHSQIPIIQNK